MMSALALLRETQDLGSALPRKPKSWPLSDQRGHKSWLRYPRLASLCEDLASGRSLNQA